MALTRISLGILLALINFTSSNIHLNETSIKDLDSLISEKIIDTVISDSFKIRKLEAINDIRKRDVNTTEESNVESTEDETEDTTIYYEYNSSEVCVGEPDYCNMTREAYFRMIYDYIYPQTYEWVLIATNAIVFVIGLIGNALVCIAVYRNHSMRTVTNYFIVNLAVADFMVILICLPPTVLWDVTETWFFGTAMCRIVLYFQSVSVTVSVLTLTFISVDRWYAICFPLKFKSTTSRAKTAILIIWVLSLSFNVPEFVVLQVERRMQLRFDAQFFMQCSPTWSDERLAATRRTTPSIHTNASTEGQLRSRRKAAKMLVAVVVMFAVCYFPVHLVSVLRVAYDVRQSDIMTCIALISHVMCYANSAVNPLIYNFMSGK
ncbi:unnamed protein product [Pieris macdunnoughi]|nr:unnamed protein product [Pieris macdunnoughi]